MLTSLTARNDYALNGATVIYPYGFRIFAAVDLQVIRRSAVTGSETILNYPADFAVSGVGNTSGGSVTLVSAGTNGDTLTIRRNTAITQATDLANQGRYAPADIEAALDRLTGINQQQQDQLDRTLKLALSVNPAGKNITLVPVAGQVVTGDASGGLTMATIATAAAVALPGQGRTVGTLSAYLANNTIFNVLDYAPAGVTINDGIGDATSAIQAAINAAKPTHGQVKFPPGVYLVTNSLTIGIGTVLVTDSGYLFYTGFGTRTPTVRINFAPTTVKDLFIIDPTGNYVGYVFHIAIGGFSIVGNGANSRYALNLAGVAYSRFSNLGIEGFVTPVLCNSTMNNRFEEVYGIGTTSAVDYAGATETSDLWDHCSFRQSPSGVRFLGKSIAIRFRNCLWETLDNYGMEIARECENIMVDDSYCENVPATANANGAMFRVGSTGAVLAIENHLIIKGGRYGGRNAANSGNFLDADFCNGVIAIGVDASRWVYVVRTTANTRDNSIVWGGGAGVQWTTGFTNNVAKIHGFYPNSVINSGAGQGQDARLGNVHINGAAGSALVIDKLANNVGRFQQFVGDGSIGSVDGDVYLAMLNTALHFWGGALGRTEFGQVSVAGSFVWGAGALATNATDGFMYIPACAGAPTGVPTAFAGRVPMVYDNINNFLYAYLNGTWKKTTVFA